MSTLETGVVTHPTVPPDWDRYYERDLGRGNKYRPDVDVWREMETIVVTADRLGYDFAFAPEHHVSPYGMCADPLQWMTYVAGRTERIGLGTSVVVLPWHNPVRVAEQMALLDNFAPDRRKWFGVGRGVAPFEYAAMSTPYDDRRERFDEAVEIVKLALANEVFSYDGDVFQVPEMTLRPKPVTPDLSDRLLVTATSDDTLVAGGARGLGLLYAGQKSTDLVRRDLELVNSQRVRLGLEPTQPLLITWMACCESEQQAYERIVSGIESHMFELVNNYAQMMWDATDRDAGYEAFVTGTQTSAGPDDLEKVQTFIDKQIWGTPDQCLEKIRALQEQTGAVNVTFQIQYGDITNEQAIDSIETFAKSSMDKLHSIPTDPPEWLYDVSPDGPLPASDGDSSHLRTAIGAPPSAG